MSEKPECDGGEYKTQRDPEALTQPHMNPQTTSMKPFLSVFSCLWIRDFKVLIKGGGETKGLSLYRIFWRECVSKDVIKRTHTDHIRELRQNLQTSFS